MRLLSNFLGARPSIEPQAEAADCGYVCISAIMALLGAPKAVDEIKQNIGTTSRGLTIKQVRDGLGKFGVPAEAMFFDKNNIAAYPNLGLLLLDRGHFVVVSRKRGQKLEIYDPVVGWYWIALQRLRRFISGYGILVHATPQRRPRAIRPAGFNRQLIKATLEGRHLWRALGLFACAQIIALLLPLLSMRSVDSSLSMQTLGLGSTIIIGFLALSVTNALSNIAGESMQAKLKQRMYRRLGGLIFDRLQAKQPTWFENVSGPSITNQIGSLQVHLDFIVDALRAGATLAVAIVAGICVLVFISPWLAVPGLISLVLATALDLALVRRQRGLISAAVEAGQRRHAYVFGTLVQLPLMVRHGSLRRCRAEYVRLMARAGRATAALQVLEGWQSTLTLLVKSAEMLVFVTLAAWFMSEGAYTIGGFVALGAYKDLLATSLSSALQLGIRYNSLSIHRIQAGKLLQQASDESASPTGMNVASGRLSVRNLSYRYGSLDNPALRNVNFDVQAGECLVIKGASGSGKTTLAKLLTGVASPLEGEILIDGRPLAYPVDGLAAVLQTDQLISGSIRENITLYRADITDLEIWKALETCCADSFVRDLPMRLNTVVAEGMAGLSGGQRQRILLARAVVGQPKILLLDEATASLDVETESTIMRNLRSLGLTLIVISHRPEVWSFGDKTIEMAGGACVSPQPTASGQVGFA